MQQEFRLYASDVITAGSIDAAVYAELRSMAEERDDLLLADESVTNGQTFVTSGPGGGWTKEFDSYDYARAAAEMWMGPDQYYEYPKPGDTHSCHVVYPDGVTEEFMYVHADALQRRCQP